MFAYGSVPSRRFGQSIGVSPIPAKVCSYSCVYCQLGRTRGMVRERKSFFPKETIFSDIEKVVDANRGQIDVITFVGDGEPTLNSDLGWILQRCCKAYRYNKAVITNGSLLSMKSVREDLMYADIVNITMSAARPDTFKKLHRPHGELKLETVLRGIADFAKDFKGKLWAEVMLVDGVNTDSSELLELKELIDEIGFDKTYIMVPTRPPTESWVRIPPAEKVMKAISLFQGEDITQVEKGEFGLREFANAREAILEITHRHPLRIEQACTIESYFNDMVLEDMIKEGVLNQANYQGGIFLLPAEFVRR